MVVKKLEDLDRRTRLFVACRDAIELISLATGVTHHGLQKRLNYCLTDWSDNEVNEICDDFIYKFPSLIDSDE